jgi:hypothetical protein
VHREERKKAMHPSQRIERIARKALIRADHALIRFGFLHNTMRFYDEAQVALRRAIRNYARAGRLFLCAAQLGDEHAATMAATVLDHLNWCTTPRAERRPYPLPAPISA